MRGVHRDGFEILRDIVTRHRRAWTERYPDYLERRCNAQLRAVGDEYLRYVADKAKAPTPKKSRDIASEAAAHWFGGDLTGVYGALGLESPLRTPTYARVLPSDWRAFVSRVFALHGGRPLAEDEVDHDPELVTRNNRLDTLAGESLKWVELYELHGRAPTLEEFGRKDSAHYATRRDGRHRDRLAALRECVAGSARRPRRRPRLILSLHRLTGARPSVRRWVQSWIPTCSSSCSIVSRLTEFWRLRPVI